MRIVVTGATGQLGRYLVDELLDRDEHRVIPWGRRPVPGRWGPGLRAVELTDEAAVVAALEEADPEVILHAAAISTAEAVRRDPAVARAVNVEATRTLAAWCLRRGRRLLFTSTDMVFDGKRGWYREEDLLSPILAYGRSKAEAERVVVESGVGLVARISLLYGPSRIGRLSFYDQSVGELKAGRGQVFFEDEYRTPLDYATAARILVDLAASTGTGVVHVGGRERLSRFDLMRRVASALGLDVGLVAANRLAEVAMPEPRPADTSLDTGRLESLLPGVTRPTVEQAIRIG